MNLTVAGYPSGGIGRLLLPCPHGLADRATSPTGQPRRQCNNFSSRRQGNLADRAILSAHRQCQRRLELSKACASFSAHVADLDCWIDHLQGASSTVILCSTDCCDCTSKTFLRSDDCQMKSLFLPISFATERVTQQVACQINQCSKSRRLVHV
jgi:hypothetical protein